MPPTLHPGFSDQRRPPPVTTLGCLFFLIVQVYSFLLYSLSQHSHLDYIWLPTPHYPVTVWLTGHHAMPAFIRGGKHSKHVHLLTYIAWLPPVINNSRLIFKHFKTADALLVVKRLIKIVATLISCREPAVILTSSLK